MTGNNGCIRWKQVYQRFTEHEEELRNRSLLEILRLERQVYWEFRLEVRQIKLIISFDRSQLQRPRKYALELWRKYGARYSA